jgi:hypothetical protein
MDKRVLVAVVAVALGCGAEPAVDDDRPGACGEETEHALTVHVAVVDGEGAPVLGALVRLEERAARAGVRGESTTDAAGEATLAGLSITDLEGCWGTALSYFVVASLGDRTAEVGVNPSLFNAIQAGEGVVDRRDRPLTLR